MLVCALVVVSGPIAAQNPLGSITGTVVDQTGGVLPGVTVTLVNEGTGSQVQTTVTNDEGVFTFLQLSPGSFTVKIEADGFKTASYTQVKVEPGRQYSLVAKLEVGGGSELVQVTAGSDLVNTTSAEIANTVIRRQIIDLPLDGRNPINLIRLQAGVVGLPTRTTTTINGGRPTWTQMTQDGINIQDNFIRTNSLDFVPNRPTSDTIGEFTITTNTQGADSSGGSSQVRLVTPSGSSQFHGALYEYNRNSALGATTWFNNATIDKKTGKTLPKPFLNRNQFGGNVGGPVKLLGLEDDLFFFFSYEGYRQRTQATPNNTIPVNDDFLNGVFRYVRPSDGTVQAVNILNPGGTVPALVVDSKMKAMLFDLVPKASTVNNYDVGNSSATRLLNTAGYRFNQTDQNDRDQYSFRFDYHLKEAHQFEFVHQRFKEKDDRTDLDTINPRPKVYTWSDVKLVVGAWRWMVSPTLMTEFRGGANLAPVDFLSDETFRGYLFTTPNNTALPFITDREATFQPQGRNTRTRQWTQTTSWLKGAHSLQMGGSLQQIRVNPYNYAGRFPTVFMGFSGAAPVAQQLVAANFPGGSISATDLANANTLRAFLGGVIHSENQTFQVKDRNSGYVGGIPESRDFLFDNWSIYAQDNWRIKPNLSLRFGLKWEYFSPLREEGDLALMPVIPSGKTGKDVLMDPNGSVDFVNGGFYGRDLNNFGPTFGLAWDPFRDGKTSFRFGYTMAFVNEETVTVGRNAATGNAGLSSTASITGLYTTVQGGVPVIPSPAFKVPRTYGDQLTLSNTSATFAVDPKIQQPKVHQLSFAVEREIGWDIAVEGRYVSTMGRGIWRGLDYNQNNAAANQPFFDDFMKARSNGFLALAAAGSFNPAYNAAIQGSQQLSEIPKFGGGYLTNSSVRSYLQTGQVASLADWYVANNYGPARSYFLANPGIYASDLILNGASTDYHALQTELRRRFAGGIFGQVNYTFSKVLSNSTGTSQQRFEPFIDNARPQLERTRADFDVTHILNGSAIFELPFGPGKKWATWPGIPGKILGGWQISSIVHSQSGAPISILSARGTFNRGGRSANNPVNSTLSAGQIKDLFGIQKMPDGRVFYIDPKITDPKTGRAVGADNLNNEAGFSGQVFFHPTAGTIGNLQRLQFDGPSQTQWDFSLMKRTAIRGEATNLELRADFLNFLNHPLFYVADYNVDSATFGRITSLNFGPRVIQVAMKLNF